MSTATAPAPDLMPAHGHACQRSGRGRGCYLLRWTLCRTCGWWGELWEGEQPPLADAAHVCDPDDVARQDRLRRTDG